MSGGGRPTAAIRVHNVDHERYDVIMSDVRLLMPRPIPLLRRIAGAGLLVLVGSLVTASTVGTSVLATAGPARADGPGSVHGRDGSLRPDVAATGDGQGARPDGRATGTKHPLLALDQDFPDPDILKAGDTYYVYSTNSAKTLPVASATSLDGPWTVQQEDALPRLGEWASPGFTWAPDVSRRADGTFLLYYTARHTASNRQCIGAATADSPRGPFVPVGAEPLVCPAEAGGAIDASSFVDRDGRRYLLYKNDGNAIGLPTTIYLQPVAPDGVTFTGERVPLISNDGDEGWLVEAPVLVRQGTSYNLFYATGEYWNGTYATRIATAPSVAGPYTKADRPLLSTATFDESVTGPGGADVLQDPAAGDHIVFHGVRDGGYRALYVAELGWAADDTPVVRGSRFRVEGETGRVHHATVRTDATGASGGAVVADLDHPDSWVELEVYAPRSGAYTLHVGYGNASVDSNGAERAARHHVTVDGRRVGTIEYPFTGSDTWGEATIDARLSAGSNTVRLGPAAWVAEVDYVDVA
jgi:arabinan endo-1,5-alpha-L-arabinosidase